MTSSALLEFSQGVASYLSSIVFPSVVKGLMAKGVQSSVEELLAMTHTPTVPPQPSPAFHNMAFGAAAVPAAVSSVPAKARSTAPVAPGQGCDYEFQRGANKGSKCGKACQHGSHFCSKAHEKTPKTATAKVGVAASGFAPGFAPALNGALPQVPQPPAVQDSTLDAVPWGTEGLLLNEKYGFILHQTPEGAIVAVKRMQGSNPVPQPLNATDIALATSMGLQVPQQTIAAPISVAPPAVPSILAPVQHIAPPTVPAIPSILAPVQHIAPPIVPAIIPAISAPTIPIPAPAVQ